MQSNKLRALVNTMFKIGCVGFGGGTALIPIIEEEVVDKAGIITEEEYNKEVMIASLTPGALPVEIAAGLGKEACGIKGMMISASAMALPGTFLTVLLMMILSGAEEIVTTQIGYLAVGISAFIIVMLWQYIFNTVVQADNLKEKYLYGVIILGIFILSGEKNIYQLFGLEITPIFNLSTIQILAAALFVILFTGGKLRDLKRLTLAILVTGLYFLCTGARHMISKSFAPYIKGLMILLAAAGLLQAIITSNIKGRFPWKDMLYCVVSWFAFVMILSLPALVISSDTIFFMGKGFLSSIMSFGGGDAYLTTAQGLFVDQGMVSNETFYGSIVTVSNALPGSILCKILTAIGYTLGYEINHSLPEAVAYSLCGFGVSVAASGLIFILMGALYEKYEDLRIFAVLKRFIRPIISGLLLNVVLSLYFSCITVQEQAGWIPGRIQILALAIMILNFLLSRRKKVHFTVKVVLSAAISMIVCNLF